MTAMQRITRACAVTGLVALLAGACASPTAPAPPTGAPVPTQPVKPAATAQPTTGIAQATTAPAQPTTATAQPTSAPTAAASSFTRLTVSYSERVGSYPAAHARGGQGIFNKHGLNPELVLLAGAPGMSALLSGQVQIAQIEVLKLLAPRRVAATWSCLATSAQFRPMCLS